MATSVALAQALENRFTRYHEVWAFSKLLKKGAQRICQNQGEEEDLVCFRKSLNSVSAAQVTATLSDAQNSVLNAHETCKKKQQHKTVFL